MKFFLAICVVIVIVSFYFGGLFSPSHHDSIETTPEINFVEANNKNIKNVKSINKEGDIHEGSMVITTNSSVDKYNGLISIAFSNGNVAKIDDVFQELIETSSLSRNEKVSLLFKLLEVPHTNLELRYIAENLARLNPVKYSKLISQMIEESTDKNKKITLIRLLKEALYFNDKPSDIYDDELVWIKEDQLLSKQFLKDIIFSESDKEISTVAFLSFIAVSDPQDIIDISYEMRPLHERI